MAVAAFARTRDRPYRVPDWYQDAKFGIFIHWGPNAVLEAKDFRDKTHLFKAEEFDPVAWARLFNESGPELQVQIKREVAKRRQLCASELAVPARSMIDGSFVGDSDLEGDNIDLVLVRDPALELSPATCPCFKDPFGGHAQVAILLDGAQDQLVESWIVQSGPPIDQVRRQLAGGDGLDRFHIALSLTRVGRVIFVRQGMEIGFSICGRCREATELAQWGVMKRRYVATYASRKTVTKGNGNGSTNVNH